jgi:MFS transporter, DHA2 family, multidrug resistance protein
MALLLAVAPRLLPEFRDPQAGRPDIISAALCIATVLAVIYGVKRIAGHGAIGFVIASIGFGLLTQAGTEYDLATAHVKR